MTIPSLCDYYRLPADSFGRIQSCDGSQGEGVFQFGAKVVRYGKGKPSGTGDAPGNGLSDPWNEMGRAEAEISLPLSLPQVIEGLRSELYVRKATSDRKRLVNHPLIRSAYYFARELFPTSFRRHLQRAYFSDWRSRPFPSWPVDFTVDTLHERFLRSCMEASGVGRIPFIWFWPDGASNGLIMTHDVETAAGRDFCSALMDLNESYGIKASFQSIPEKRYEIPDEFFLEIRGRGFEFNVHDLNHDGHLFDEREEFLRRAKKINEYIRQYDARGFRAGAMYRNQGWYDAFDFSYDMSVPNVAHLEPQRGGCCTVMPYFIGKIVELPLTATQDYSLFHILNEHSIDLWKKQLELLRKRNGLMSFIAHPDYLIDSRNRKVFESLLDYLRQMMERENIWMALPGEVDQWWRARSQMQLVARNGGWEIEGPENERARLAFAVLDDSGGVVYEVAGVSDRNVAHRL